MVLSSPSCVRQHLTGEGPSARAQWTDYLRIALFSKLKMSSRAHRRFTSRACAHCKILEGVPSTNHRKRRRSAPVGTGAIMSRRQFIYIWNPAPSMLRRRARWQRLLMPRVRDSTATRMVSSEA
jgi:hypothetical protein